MADEAQRQLRAYVEYFRDLGVYDFYRRGEAGSLAWPEVEAAAIEQAPLAAPVPVVASLASIPSAIVQSKVASVAEQGPGVGLAGKLVSFDDLAPHTAPQQRPLCSQL